MTISSDATCGGCVGHAAFLMPCSCSPARLEARLELCCRGVNTEGADAECCDTTCALIEACLSSDIAARPTAAQLVAALERLQGDAAEPGSQPVSAQLVAALGQLQANSGESQSRPSRAVID
jgi:hypothetical protein